MSTGKSVFVFICIGSAIVMSLILADRVFNHGTISKEIGIDDVPNSTDQPASTDEKVVEIDIYEQDEQCPHIFPNEMLEDFSWGPNNTYGQMHNSTADLLS